ncbi:MAG: hypothetical protein LC627_05340, partial [Verrucomicrobiaceae bacterium]|nr:hypothetical protein [Verrucomicrobiaceae bacterium]
MPLVEQAKHFDHSVDLTARLTLEAQEQSWPLDKPFRIARGSRTEARVIVVSVSNGEHTGRGEAVPISRYGQSIASTLAQIESVKGAKGLDRHHLQALLAGGAARNALDCAFWDLESKISGKRAWELINIDMLPVVETALTIGLDTPDAMAAASANATALILKVKLGGDALDLSRVEAVRKAAPATRL